MKVTLKLKNFQFTRLSADVPTKVTLKLKDFQLTRLSADVSAKTRLKYSIRSEAIL